MAVKMRLKRLGYKKHPIYRVVVADARTQRDGGVIDQIGTYDPNQWLNNGAQPTETVAKLLKQAGVEK